MQFLAFFSIRDTLCSRLLAFSLPVFWHFLQCFGRKLCFLTNSKVFTSQTLEALSWRTIKFKLNPQPNAKKCYPEIKFITANIVLPRTKNSPLKFVIHFRLSLNEIHATNLVKTCKSSPRSGPVKVAF